MRPNNPALLVKHVYRFVFALFACGLPGLIQAQTIIVNPSSSGGFESGTTFADNGWTVVNGSSTNKWFVGDPAGFGSNRAYISGDDGLTYGYENTSATSVHFYRDVTFPAGESKITLSFTWMGLGESNPYDGLQVSIAPTSVTPVANTFTTNGTVTGAIVPGATVVGNTFYYNSVVDQTETITIPSSVTGNCSSATTMRLIFTFRNDFSAGDQPPISVDNISLTTQNYSLLSSGGVFTINNTLGTSGTNYKTFTDAISELNFVSGCGGFSAPIIFNVSAGQSFFEDPPSITASGTVTTPITFQRTGAGANPSLRASGGTGQTGAFTIEGGDYITFDGIDVRVANNSTAVEYGYYIRSFGTSNANGAQRNTIKNVSVILNRANAQSIGIYQNTLTAASQTGTCSYNSYYNVKVENAYTGIYLNGSLNFPDVGCIIGTQGTGTTVIGGTTANDIGGGTASAYGIRAESQSELTIRNTEVRNVGLNTTFTQIAGGISLESMMGTNNVYKNRVHDIGNIGTGNANVFGIRADIEPGDTVNIYNNFIYGLSTSSTTVGGTPNVRGIQINTLGGSTGLANVTYNNVRVDIANSNASSAALYLQAGALDCKNNVLANLTPAGTGGQRFAIVVQAGTLVSDYNDLYIPSGTNNYIGFAAGAVRQTMLAWNAATSQDANSVSVDPYFTSPTDLHVGNGVLNAKATIVTVPVISDDIDGDVRDAFQPDIGADEITLTPKVLSSITYTQASTARVAINSTNVQILRIAMTTSGNAGVLPLDSIRISSLNTSDADVLAVKLYRTASATFSTVNLMGTSTFVNGDASFTGLAYDLPGNSTTYFWVVYDVAGVEGNFLDAQVTAGSISVSGLFYPATNQSPAGQREITGPMSGTFLVGAGQTTPNYTSLTAAVSDLTTFGINGAIIFELQGDYNSNLETFPIIINPITGSSETNTVTIKPAAGTNPLITGSAVALFRLQGADNIIFDGSNNGTTSRNLTLSNNFVPTGTGGAAAIWLSSLGTGAGASNNRITNCNIMGGATSSNIFGIVASSQVNITQGGADNDNLIIRGNEITRAFIGINIIGLPTFLNDNLNITNNIIGDATDALSMGNTGISFSYSTNALIEKNTIFNVRGNQFGTNSPKGINVNTGNTGAAIIANTISDIIYTATGGGGGKGIDIQTGSTNTSIINNSISNIRGDGWNNQGNLADVILGIRVQSSSVIINNNSINLGSGPFAGNNNSTAVSAAVGIIAGVANLTIKNNILSSNLQNTVQPAAKTYAIYSMGTSAAFAGIDFNNYYTSGTQSYLAFIGGADRTTLAAIRTGFGDNDTSMVVDPGFTTPTNLQPKLGYYNSGTPIDGITTDITGALRYSIPDIGAYEGPASGRWEGLASSDWSSASNWKNGVVPTSTTDVAISVAAPNMPVLVSSADARNIVMPTTATIVNLANQTLTVSGAISGDGSLSVTNASGLNVMAAAGTVKFTTGANTIKILNLEAGASMSLANQLNIASGATAGSVTVGTGAILNSLGNLVLKSDANGTARVSASTGTITGNVTVERYIPASGNRAWRLLTVPVDAATSPTLFTSWQESGLSTSGYGTHITDLNGSGDMGFDASTVSVATSVRYYDGTTTQAPLNTNATRVTDHGGAFFLFVRGDRNININNTSASGNTTLRARGVLKQGNQTTGVAGASFSLITNPYASSVDYEAIKTGNPAAPSTFKTWDANLGSVGGYRTVERINSSTYEQTPSAGAVADNAARYIQSSQAFFIPANMQLNFTESMKTASMPITNVYRTPTPGEQVIVNLYVRNGSTATLSDGIRVKYDDTYSAAVTAEDILKLNNFTENLGVSRDNKVLSVEKRPFITADDTVFLRLTGTGIKQYRLQVEAINLATSGLTAYLRDAYLNTLTPLNLSGTTEVDFDVVNIAGSYATDRFTILFRPSATLAVAGMNISAVDQEGKVLVKWTALNEQNMVSYEVQRSINGIEFNSLTTVAAKGNKGMDELYSSFDGSPNSGENLYRIKATDKSGKVQYSGVVKVKVGTVRASVSVYPNPVKGQELNLQFSDMQEGTYNVTLFNNMGQQVYSTRVNHPGGSSAVKLSITALASAGTYNLSVSNNNTTINQTIVSQ